MSDMSIRKLPFSLEAEQSVLGAILIDPPCYMEIGEIVSYSDFYLEEHQNIFLAMQELFSQSRDIDLVTLIDTLVRKGVYDEAGGRNYIKIIAEIVPSSANVKEYARIVYEKSLLRRLIAATEEISETAYSEQDDVMDVINSAEQKIFDIAQVKKTHDFVPIQEVLLRSLDELNRNQQNKGKLPGVPTGFSALDRVLVTMGDSDLVLVGARPGMGKTSFALNIATQAALQTGKAVCIFSLEMSAEQLVQRLLSSEALVDSHSMRSGELTAEHWESLAVAASRLSGTNIFIDDSTGISATGMKAKLRRVKNLGLVVIDYLQLMKSDIKTDNRVQEVADISRNLKLLAKELRVPVVTCAQLSRSVESRQDKTPMLSDLRDSGAIEQDADIVMFLHREDYYNDDPDKANLAHVIIAKNRHGSTGKVDMGWQGQYTKFISIDQTRE